MFAVKKVWLCLISIALLSYEVVQAKVMGFEEVISVALKENFDILIAKSAKKSSLLSNRLSNLHIWLPTATFTASQENRWQQGTKSFYFRSDPIFTLTWDLQSISNKIFQTRLNGQHNVLNNLIATKTISDALQKVVTCYYELALAQKKMGAFYYLC